MSQVGRMAPDVPPRCVGHIAAVGSRLGLGEVWGPQGAALEGGLVLGVVVAEAAP